MMAGATTALTNVSTPVTAAWLYIKPQTLKPLALNPKPPNGPKGPKPPKPLNP